MGRFVDTLEIPEKGDLKPVVITSEALGYEASEDLLPEIMDIVGGMSDRVTQLVASGAVNLNDDILKLAPALSGLASRLAGGRLRNLAGRILAGTSVVMFVDGEKNKFDLVKKDERATVFEARPDIYFATLLFAAKVTFGRFFPGLGQAKKDSPKAP